MDESIERLEQLNRVLRHVGRDKLNMSNWCGCAIGHARQDQYFVKNFNPEFEKSLSSAPLGFLTDYFGLESEQTQSLFLSSGYSDLKRDIIPSDVVSKIEVILMAKRAAQPLVEETQTQTHLEFAD